MIELSGKRILVTAAAAGIGKATAELAAQCGAQVVATDIDADGLSRTEAPNIRTEVLDGTDPEAVSGFFGRSGNFHGVVNAVGYVHHGTIEECSEADWHRSFKMNVDSMFYVMRCVVPAMAEAGGGSIVNIASAASSLKAFASRFAYGATKAAVIGLSRSVALDYVKRGVRCNAICPATVDTPSMRERARSLGEAMGDVDAGYQAFVDRQPMGRIGTAEEVASLAVFLLSDASAFTTGQTHVIDGGVLT